MNKKDTTYRMPEGFDPHAALNAARGLADAVHWFLLEGPGTARVIPSGDRAGLNALVELLRGTVQELHEYFAELENRTVLELPRSQEELDALDIRFRNEVREAPALYLVR